jgi:hypothetical protein
VVHIKFTGGHSKHVFFVTFIHKLEKHNVWIFSQKAVNSIDFKF